MAARKKKKKATRKRTRLTVAVSAQIVSYVRAGAYFKHACQAAGIPYDTAKVWLSKGDREAREPYHTFAHDVRKAQAEDVLRDVSTIGRAAEGKKAVMSGDGRNIVSPAIPMDWKAAAWKLERKYPKQWGAKVQLLVQQELEDAMAKLQRGLTPDEYDKVLRLLAEDDQS